jgi:hypothetical protein
MKVPHKRGEAIWEFTRPDTKPRRTDHVKRRRYARRKRTHIGRIVRSGVHCRRFGANLGVCMRAAWLRRAGSAGLSYLAVPAAGPGGSPAREALPATGSGARVQRHSRGPARLRRLLCFLPLPYRHRRPVAAWLRCVAWMRRSPSSRTISAAGVSRQIRSWSGWPLRPARLAAGGR